MQFSDSAKTILCDLNLVTSNMDILLIKNSLLAVDANWEFQNMSLTVSDVTHCFTAKRV